MKKLLALLIIFGAVLSVSVSSATAYEAGDPCLLYGYDPDELDIYDTYGDQVFLGMNRELKTPTKKITIFLNNFASQRIIEKSENMGCTAEIINETYFPELKVESVYCILNDPDNYDLLKKYYLSGNSKICVIVSLENWSRDTFSEAVVSIAPRVDIDIESVSYKSYGLGDVVTALKHIAGWDGYRVDHSTTPKMRDTLRYIDINLDDVIDLNDVSYMLKVIAGWDVDEFYSKIGK